MYVCYLLPVRSDIYFVCFAIKARQRQIGNIYLNICIELSIKDDADYWGFNPGGSKAAPCPYWGEIDLSSGGFTVSLVQSLARRPRNLRVLVRVRARTVVTQSI